ncbi:large conductance mechanosensitive channel protein MscL [Candidatus Kaiserbacteria bacterium CG10_big_fil_rev_8_21_14_0_10_43_70]|uniref:Large conductance mechanosensitive channel protein MscL n=1 Tax=Candidatus Kaiserbacteria bacterium CG10_big_fil_rev_8_21_14_0_10_43_70 TaxID=1974605 RepID=A0A2H0UIQ4_9BACT|nr:MAG: large conductance mechanosensitive channel protein MscL [Candidatus Kaiserbacteria bacterium CG10_big_fil_rev_8_21_14_0_10_43_70]
MKKLSGFMDFIREQGVVGLAIGFILGGAVSKVVSSLVSDVINPIIGLIFGSKEGLSSLSIGVVNLGAFVAVIIDFVVIAAVVYFIFKGLGFDKLDKKK